MADKLIAEGLRRAAEEGDKQRQFEKEQSEKASAERKAKLAETAKNNAADTYRTQISQQAFDFGGPEKNTASQDKARSKAAENEEFKDKRVKSSPLIANAELEKMREILDKKPIKTSSQSSLLSPKGNITKAGSGSAGGDKKALKPAYKKGGSVKSSASSRGDGCAQRGKTKGRMV